MFYFDYHFTNKCDLLFEEEINEKTNENQIKNQ